MEFQNLKYYTKICEKLEKENIKVLSFDGHTVKAFYIDLEFDISFELCMCHGGRLTISSKHCSFYQRIEHEEYPEGFETPELELEYEIEVEMVPIIKSMKSYVYKFECYREDKPDSHHITYYKNVEDLSRAVFEEDGMDVFSFDGEFIHYYPNECMASKIVFEKFENNKVYILRQDLERKDVRSEWVTKTDKWSNEHIICSIMRKGNN